MSLTTVAAEVQPDPLLARLPASKPERFQLSDFIAAAIVFAVTLGVYIATLAPTVTLEDSGELITASAKFGVGHPPGYPLWTMCGFLLTHLVPFGSLAWRINLLCAIFGGISNAILTLLACHSGRWLLQRWTEPELQAKVRPYVFYVGIFAGMVIGFSDAMWGQAVIAAVHGTLNALFVNITLLAFYLWMIRPEKIHRIVLAVFIFALGLTNHHTLVQAIPAFLFAALTMQLVPILRGRESGVPMGTFFSLFTAVCLFSLSILVDISWLSSDEQLHAISTVMAVIVFVVITVIAFIYTREFTLKLFLLGALSAIAVFAYGHYFLSPAENDFIRFGADASHWWLRGSFAHPGWMQITSTTGLVMLLGAALALGLVFTSTLNRRMIIGIFAAGWVGLVPYYYEIAASSTHPPMNWGYAAQRNGFYYEVSREQYPKALPNLIKMTFGKLIGVVPKDAQLDATINQGNYLPRLAMTFYYYGENLTQNFTVPLILLALGTLFFARRLDWPQVNWFLFLGASFFALGFMLMLISPQETFDFERNLQYKVFHLQSHCIFVLLVSYGALALIVYLQDLMPEVYARTGVIGFGVPAMFLSLLPLWNNFDGCSQAGHWFGYWYGADMMRPMEKNAVYFGGSDPGRFVPTFMAFVESQQPDKWKADWSVYPEETKARGSGFDRRDVTVITQNALCDTYYAHYIRDQYDDRFRPKTWTPLEKWLGRDKAYPEIPVQCVSEDELRACWAEYRAQPEVAERMKAGGPELRSGTADVFDINGIVAKRIFDANKKAHVFYIEQSTPITWMYPYLLPAGLIFKLANDPLDKLPADAVAQDRKFWDDYAARLLADPIFHYDIYAQSTFAKLAFWHADLYRNRKMDAEEEYWLRLSLRLCPQLQDATVSLAYFLIDHKRFDDAIAVAKAAQEADPRNDYFDTLVYHMQQAKIYGEHEVQVRAKLSKNPYDVQLNLELARVLQDQAKYPDVNDTLRRVAGMTNWTHEDMANVVRYYVDHVHNVEAAIAFLEARAKIDPSESEMIYSLAAMHASIGHRDEALKNLGLAVKTGGTNAITSAKIDPRFESLRDDPAFEALLNSSPSKTNAAPATNAAPSTNAAPTNTDKPVKLAKKKK